jgi:Protein of unknown function (DUF3761)
MRRIWAALLFVLGALVLVSAPAAARTDHTLTGCRAAAVAFQDATSASSSSATTALSELAKSKDAALRKISKAIAADETNAKAMRRLGSYCKKHYPKVRAIRVAAFVPATTATSTTSPTTTTTTTATTAPPATAPPATQPPPPPPPPPTEAPNTAPPAPSCPNGTYVNAEGNTVCAPYDSPSGPPAGATAQCNDGTYSFSQNHSGTCSGHGGVQRWL